MSTICVYMTERSLDKIIAIVIALRCVRMHANELLLHITTCTADHVYALV